MRIGIDARLVAYREGGISQYARMLVQALARIDQDDQFVILQHRRSREPLVVSPNFSYRNLWTPPHHRWEQWLLPLELALSKIDLLHSPDFIPPIHWRGPSVITIHDLAFLRLPNILTEESYRYYLQVGRAVKRVQGIIVDSETTKRDVQELLGVSGDRLDIVYSAPDPGFQEMDNRELLDSYCRERGLPSSFVLWVGTIEPRKNLTVLLEAMSSIKGKLPSDREKLVIAGGTGWLYEDALARIEALGLREQVIMTGPVPQEEMALLYNAAWLFVFPSLYEGFGLPPLEAMACGTPVISSNAPALPEVLGDAPLYFEPKDADALADAILRVAEDPRLAQEMRLRGLARSRSFSWEEAAAKTLAVYRRAAR